ncbi:794af904-952e-46b4-9478-2ab326c6bbf4 [Thermothielavioides terrestris]|uniref:794af904-952e-46b4-9478-2ab326c6bbf4 n=1 Tax=Thermothielavioides terrestris TaxID=2587410 RepID=A0A446B700_9PEZI|nr:794af904-952e-46b4-9478-2ab326c6bbf4 [Thermothielavioides terrestris]
MAEPSPASPPRTNETDEATAQPAGSSTAAAILPASHWESIALEPEGDDADSGYNDVLSSTASLASSILHYRTVHGRTYHASIGNADAWEPNDDMHAESMDIHHHMSTLMLGDKLFLAPIGPNPKRVLDIGTGTGIWAIDFADAYPGTEVIGTDLSPMQPAWVPPNVKWELDDANLDWTWGDNTMDFIHARMLVGNIVDWRKFYRDAFRCCKPGGWMESHEASLLWRSDVGIREDSAMGQWGHVFQEAGRKIGRTFRLVDDELQQKYMAEAGFVDIVVKDIKCPSGDWPKDEKQKELGLFARLALLSDLNGYILHIWGSVMGWTPEEIAVYAAHMRRELSDPKIQPWFLRRVVYGRKPETS